MNDTVVSFAWGDLWQVFQTQKKKSLNPKREKADQYNLSQLTARWSPNLHLHNDLQQKIDMWNRQLGDTILLLLLVTIWEIF